MLKMVKLLKDDLMITIKQNVLNYVRDSFSALSPAVKTPKCKSSFMKSGL